MSTIYITIQLVLPRDMLVRVFLYFIYYCCVRLSSTTAFLLPSLLNYEIGRTRGVTVYPFAVVFRFVCCVSVCYLCDDSYKGDDDGM